MGVVPDRSFAARPRRVGAFGEVSGGGLRHEHDHARGRARRTRGRGPITAFDRCAAAGDGRYRAPPHCTASCTRKPSGAACWYARNGHRLGGSGGRAGPRTVVGRGGPEGLAAGWARTGSARRRGACWALRPRSTLIGRWPGRPWCPRPSWATGIHRFAGKTDTAGLVPISGRQAYVFLTENGVEPRALPDAEPALFPPKLPEAPAGWRISAPLHRCRNRWCADRYGARSWRAPGTWATPGPSVMPLMRPRHRWI